MTTTWSFLFFIAACIAFMYVAPVVIGVLVLVMLLILIGKMFEWHARYKGRKG